MTSDGRFYVSIILIYSPSTKTAFPTLVLYSKNPQTNTWEFIKRSPLPTPGNGLNLAGCTSYVSNTDPRFPVGTLVFIIPEMSNSIFVYTFSGTSTMDVILHQILERPYYATGLYFCLDFAVTGDPCLQYLYVLVENMPGFLLYVMDPQTLLFSEPIKVNGLGPVQSFIGGVIASTTDNSRLLSSVDSQLVGNARLQVFTDDI